MTLSLPSGRRELAAGAWIHLVEGFVPDHTGLLERLLETLPLRQETVRIAGCVHPTPRLTSWHGDPGCLYRYSGRTFDPAPWTEELAELRDRLTEVVGLRLNAVLVNHYRDGQDAMGEHADDEPEVGPRPDDRRIASVSLGARRRFHLRHRTARGDRHRFDLGEGSLLVMGGTTQQHYVHRVPRTRRPVGPRLNLTFRWIRPARGPGPPPPTAPGP